MANDSVIGQRCGWRQLSWRPGVNYPGGWEAGKFVVSQYVLAGHTVHAHRAISHRIDHIKSEFKAAAGNGQDENLFGNITTNGSNSSLKREV